MERERGWYHRCIYCGCPTRNSKGPKVCVAHRDLLKRDPHYAQPRDQWATAKR